MFVVIVPSTLILISRVMTFSILLVPVRRVSDITVNIVSKSNQSTNLEDIKTLLIQNAWTVQIYQLLHLETQFTRNTVLHQHLKKAVDKFNLTRNIIAVGMSDVVEAAKDIVHVVDDTVSIAKTYRIGKKTNKTRFLKIELPDQSDAIKVLK